MNGKPSGTSKDETNTRIPLAGEEADWIGNSVIKESFQENSRGKTQSCWIVRSQVRLILVSSGSRNFLGDALGRRNESQIKTVSWQIREQKYFLISDLYECLEAASPSLSERNAQSYLRFSVDDLSHEGLLQAFEVAGGEGFDWFHMFVPNPMVIRKIWGYEMLWYTYYETQ